MFTNEMLSFSFSRLSMQCAECTPRVSDSESATMAGVFKLKNGGLSLLMHQSLITNVLLVWLTLVRRNRRMTSRTG